MKLKVQKLEAIRDLDGNLGKRIELVEERETMSRLAIMPKTEEAKITRGVFETMQVMLPTLQRTKVTIPRIILFLTEQECDSLDVAFVVNQVYEVTLVDQGLKFKKEQADGVAYS